MSRSRHWPVALILVLALILAWLILDRTQPDRNPLRDALDGVLAPLQFTTAQGARRLQGLKPMFTDRATLSRENELLKQQLAELRTQVAQLQEAQIENETLRKQLGFKSSVPSYQLLSAEVIGHDPNALLQYLIIDRGAEDGVAVAMPVLAHTGLVGRISEVSANSAKVMLISDPSSSVSAIIQRTRATGVVRGNVDGGLTMYYLQPGDVVEPGDVVLTSGLGGNFPRRLNIGQVTSVSYSDVDMFQQAEVVAPQVLRSLEEVMVLLNATEYELAEPAQEPAAPAPQAAE
ncbi:MAG: rod shape-determining protein MreC [Anaerolineae bacterium]|jgi:rod shape-determining protein MreC